ncbi:dienelactone hydrolase family protein [Escherichia coli]
MSPSGAGGSGDRTGNDFREGDPNDFADIPTLLSGLVAKVPDSQVLADLDHVASWASRNGGDVHRLMITGSAGVDVSPGCMPRIIHS